MNYTPCSFFHADLHEVKHSFHALLKMLMRHQIHALVLLLEYLKMMLDLMMKLLNPFASVVASYHHYEAMKIEKLCIDWSYTSSSSSLV